MFRSGEVTGTLPSQSQSPFGQNTQTPYAELDNAVPVLQNNHSNGIEPKTDVPDTNKDKEIVDSTTVVSSVFAPTPGADHVSSVESIRHQPPVNSASSLPSVSDQHAANSNHAPQQSDLGARVASFFNPAGAKLFIRS
jgi:hypothetical protein